jgi:hypothetical protein
MVLVPMVSLSARTQRLAARELQVDQPSLTSG